MYKIYIYIYSIYVYIRCLYFTHVNPIYYHVTCCFSHFLKRSPGSPGPQVPALPLQAGSALGSPCPAAAQPGRAPKKKA